MQILNLHQSLQLLQAQNNLIDLHPSCIFRDSKYLQENLWSYLEDSFFLPKLSNKVGSEP